MVLGQPDPGPGDEYPAVLQGVVPLCGHSRSSPLCPTPTRTTNTGPTHGGSGVSDEEPLSEVSGVPHTHRVHRPVPDVVTQSLQTPLCGTESSPNRTRDLGMKYGWTGVKSIFFRLVSTVG